MMNGSIQYMAKIASRLNRYFVVIAPKLAESNVQNPDFNEKIIHCAQHIFQTGIESRQHRFAD